MPPYLNRPCCLTVGVPVFLEVGIQGIAREKLSLKIPRHKAAEDFLKSRFRIKSKGIRVLHDEKWQCPASLVLLLCDHASTSEALSTDLLMRYGPVRPGRWICCDRPRK